MLARLIDDLEFAVAPRYVGQKEKFHIAFPRQSGGVPGRDVANLTRDIGVSIEIGRFDHKRVGILDGVADVVGAGEIAGDDNFRSSDDITKHFIGAHDAATLQDDGVPRHQLAPLRTMWHAERIGLLCQEGAARIFLEYIAITFATAVGYGEGTYGKLPPFEQGLPRHGAMKIDGDGWRLPPEDDLINQCLYTLNRRQAAIDEDFVKRFPTAECGQEAAQAQHVIQMGVRQEDVIEAFEADTAAEDLALRTLAAVNQEALFAR